MIGVGLQPVPSETASRFALGAVMIAVIVPGSPAQKAGLRAGDIIESVNGAPLSAEKKLENAPSAAQRTLARMLAAASIGDATLFDVRRGQERLIIKVFLALDAAPEKAATKLAPTLAEKRTSNAASAAMERFESETLLQIASTAQGREQQEQGFVNESNSPSASVTLPRGAALAAGKTLRDCPDICPEMVVLPAGSFLMGSPASEELRDADEGPRHPVKITYAFAVGRTEVTGSEWDACVMAGGCPGAATNLARRPVVGISWLGARAYAQWLSEKTGER